MSKSSQSSPSSSASASASRSASASAAGSSAERKSRRRLGPSEKYEVFVQVLGPDVQGRGEGAEGAVGCGGDEQHVVAWPFDRRRP